MARPGSPATDIGRAGNRTRPVPSRPTASRRAWPTDVLTAAAIIAIAALALLVAGCGGGGSAAPPASALSRSAMTAQALAYAQCMRAHGISGYPDPKPHGNIVAGPPPASIDTHSPQFQSENKTCEKKTGFGTLSAAQQQQGLAAMVKYADCMRAHGIPNYPDPTANSLRIGFSFPPGFDLNSARVRAASRACQALSPFPGSGP